jgi:hypothetical protein
MFRAPRRGRECPVSALSAKDVCSEDDEEGVSIGLQTAQTGRGRHDSFRRAVIGQAPAVPGYEPRDADDAVEATGGNNYSAEGLANLARDTAHLWEQGTADGLDLADGEVLECVPGSDRIPDVYMADEGRELSQLEHVLEARSNVFDQRRGTATYIPNAPGKFGAFAADDKSDAPVGTPALDRYNHVEGDPDSDESGGLAWETELLRRAGHGTPSADASQEAQRARARTLLEEESRVMGGRGEIGLSVADTSVANVDARTAALAENLKKIQGQVEAVENAKKRGDVEMDAVANVDKEAVGRKDFYDNLVQFLEDVVDMLRSTASDSFAKLSLETEILHGLIEERLSDVDEFGRLRLVNVSTDSDGYESPTLSGSGNERLRLVASAQGYTVCAVANGDLPSAVPGDIKDPFHDVVDEFKSLSSISKRFMDWKARYELDYEAAFGDLSLAKIAGSVALVSRQCSDFSWTSILPDAVVGLALVRARVAARMAMEIGAFWDPQSHKLSRAYATNTSFILTRLSDHEVELKLAVSTFHTSVLTAMRWKVRTLQQVAMRGGSDAVWSGRAAVKCARGTAIFMHSFPGGSDLNDVETIVVHELLGGLVCGALKELRQCDTSGKLFLDFAIFAIEQSCMQDFDEGDSKAGANLEFPDRAHEGWSPLREELYLARELVKDKAVAFEPFGDRLQVCMQRVGAV